MPTNTQKFLGAVASAWIVSLTGCGSDSEPMSSGPSTVVTPPTTSGAAGSSPSTVTGASTTTPSRTGTAGAAPIQPPPASMTTPAKPMTGAQPPPASMPPSMTTPPATPPMTPPMTPPASTAPPATRPMPTGDPNGSGATFSIPDTRCGPAPGLDAFVAGTGIPGPGTPNIKIGGRDVVLSYPCNIKEGAHVTFILNLHGTMPDEGLKTYQHGYFSAHKLVDSHKLIVATPMSKSPVGQWGNMDGGVDIPHLYEVVKWIYDKFSKVQITSMWIGGHSWGSMFAKNFVCDAMFKDKVRGVIGMSGGATLAGMGGECAARISQIHTNGEMEGGPAGLGNQTAIAAAHGCDAGLAPKDIGNKQMLYEWPNCDPGWVHFNFSMGNHEHITAIDDPVVKYIVDAIKSTEK